MDRKDLTPVPRQRRIPNSDSLPSIMRGLVLPSEGSANLIQRYLNSPDSFFLAKIGSSPRLQYIPPVLPRSDSLRPSEILNAMLLRPLAERIEQDFKGRSIALQGLACSIGKSIEFPSLEEGDNVNRRVVRSAFGLLEPSVSEGLSRLPLYIPNTSQPLIDQDIPAFEFMIASARGARTRVVDELQQPNLQDLIFPAMLVLDLEKVRGYKVMQIPGQNQQVVGTVMPPDRRARKDAVLALYVIDYPKITSGVKRRTFSR